MTSRRYWAITITLGALTALAPFSIDTYLPSFPDIAQNLHAGIEKVTLSLSGFFVGIALGQLLYGPFLDRFGRKRPLYIGLFIYILATTGCYLAPSAEVLIALRFLQAIGGCAAGIIAMAMVRDLFPIEQNIKIFSFLTLVLGTSPLLAPTVGGFITSSFGWRGIFLALLLLSLAVTIAVYFILPEARQPDPTQPLNLQQIARNYREVLVVPQFLTYASVGSLVLTALFAFITSSPAIFMTGYRVSTRVYGWIFALITFGFIGFSQLNALLGRYFSPSQTVLGAVILMSLLGALWLWSLRQEWTGLTGTALFIFLMLGCVGIINPNATALTIAPFKTGTGVAASLYGLFQWSLAGLISMILSFANGDPLLTLASLMSSASLLALFVLLIGRRKLPITV